MTAPALVPAPLDSERRGRAIGKVILVGEHFVVHGAPALALPVPGAWVEVALRPGRGARLGEEIARRGVDAMLGELGLGDLAAGWDVEVSGPLPLGAGLGGSAALAAALVRALGVVAPDEVAVWVHRLERLAHGRPSGLDGATVAWERAVWLPERAASAPTHPREAELGRAAEAELLLIEASAVPLWVGVVPRVGTTREAVAGVASRREAEPEAFAAAYSLTVELAHEARVALLAGDWARLGVALTRAHRPLEGLGLVTPALGALVAAALEAGALGAKMSGAGLGGAMIALAPEGLDLGPVLRQAGAMQVLSTRAVVWGHEAVADREVGR